MSDGTIAPADPRIVSFMLTGALNWIARWYEPDGPGSPEDIAVHPPRFFCKGSFRERRQGLVQKFRSRVAGHDAIALQDRLFA